MVRFLFFLKREAGCAAGFFFQAEDGIRDGHVTGVQTCALPIWPNQRAGFIAAPVYGPNAMMSNAITSPIVKPPVLFQGPRTSTAVPKTANTRKNVRIASITMPLPTEIPGPRAGAPP